LNGKRYLDALAGLFAVNIGYSHGEEIGQAALEQMRELPFYTNWSYAHPRAIELAAEVASLAPGDLTRAFFVSGGSEAVESAWKLARQYHSLRGERRWKAVARNVAYHGTTMGALSINGVPALRNPFEPLVPAVAHVANTARYHRPAGQSEEQFTAWLLDDLQRAIAAPFMADSGSFTHGITFGGHPVQAAVALANLEVMRRERLVDRALEREQAFRDTLAPLLELPIIGDLRGGGYFWALELVKDKDT